MPPPPPRALHAPLSRSPEACLRSAVFPEWTASETEFLQPSAVPVSYNLPMVCHPAQTAHETEGMAAEFP